ncbi:hypothetical protein IFR05_014805 [Cadophora sp. M221]|nr:hypothetical protein IFR05_014805 [Cadophora sp. M221]
MLFTASAIRAETVFRSGGQSSDADGSPIKHKFFTEPEIAAQDRAKSGLQGYKIMSEGEIRRFKVYCAANSRLSGALANELEPDANGSAIVQETEAANEAEDSSANRTPRKLFRFRIASRRPERNTRKSSAHFESIGTLTEPSSGNRGQMNTTLPSPFQSNSFTFAVRVPRLSTTDPNEIRSSQPLGQPPQIFGVDSPSTKPKFDPNQIYYNQRWARNSKLWREVKPYIHASQAGVATSLHCTPIEVLKILAGNAEATQAWLPFEIYRNAVAQVDLDGRDGAEPEAVDVAMVEAYKLTKKQNRALNQPMRCQGDKGCFDGYIFQPDG